MSPLINLLARRATVLLAVSVFLGLALPQAATLLRPLLPFAVWGLLLLAALRIGAHDIANPLRQPTIVLTTVFWLLVVSPILMAIAAGILQPVSGVTMALVLMAAAPPIMSSPALALLLGLDASAALVAMVAATLLAPLMVPTMALGLMGITLEISAGELMLRLGAMIGAAIIMATLMRRMLGPARVARLGPVLDVMAVILLIVFAIGLMDGVGERLVSEPRHVLTMIAIAFAANIGLQAVSAAAFLFAGRRRALTTGFLAGNRNMALLLAVLPAGTDPDVSLYFALGQFPLYILPMVMIPVYRHLLRHSVERA